MAAWALVLIGLFNMFGSYGAGVLGGRYNKTRLLAMVYGARAVVIAAFVLVPASGTTTLIFGAAIGLLWLTTVPLTSGIIAQQFGTANAGALFGIVFFSHQLGAFLGAWMGGYLADATGSYELAWWVAVALGVAAALVHLVLDDGPAADPPPAGVGGRQLAPLGVLVVVGALALVSLVGGAGDAEATPDKSSHSVMLWCPLHPVLPD